MNQKERILSSNAPIHNVAGASYKGLAPTYFPVVGGGYHKSGNGVPFVRTTPRIGSKVKRR